MESREPGMEGSWHEPYRRPYRSDLALVLCRCIATILVGRRAVLVLRSHRK